MKLGERLRRIRKEHNLTLKDLSQLANLSVPYLSDMERGVVNPSIDTLQKVALAYNIVVRELLTGVDGLGESRNTVHPKGFDGLLKDYGHEISEDWKDLLLRIALRGKRPSSKREWVELYLHLRRILEPEGD